MQKSLLSLFLILNCWLLATQPVMASNRDELKQKMAEQLNKPVDYTDLPNLKLTFDHAIIACLKVNDTLAIERATQLVHNLNLYWKSAYQVGKNHSSKKKLKEKKKSLIQERLVVVNSVGSKLGSLDKILDSGLPEAISLLNEAVEVGEKFFPGSVLLTDAYHNLAHNHAFRGIDLNQALEYYDKALNLKIACLGEEHFSTAKTYYDIGTAYFLSQEYNSAIPYFEKSLSIMLNCPLEEAYWVIIKSYQLLGDIYEEHGDYSNALEYYEEALSFISTLSKSKKDTYIARIENAIKAIKEKLAKQD